MGYQETYLTTKNPKDFDLLIQYVKQVGPAYYNTIEVEPVEIVTLTSSIQGDCYYQGMPQLLYNYPPGTRFLYFSGQRYAQRSPLSLLNVGIRTSIQHPWVEECSLYFTECFPSESIFDQEAPTATHEDWTWEQ